MTARKHQLAGLTLIIGALVAITAGAHAATPRSAYSYKTDTCTRIADPMTVIFYGTAATTRFLAGYERGGPFAKDVSGNITKHTGWVRHNTDNLFRQYGTTAAGCEKNPGDTDLASTSGYSHDRWHLRMWQTPQNRLTGENFFVETTPHKERWHWGDGTANSNDCGTGPGTGSHAVERGAVDRSPRDYERHGSGFDRARRFLDRAYSHSTRHHVRRGYFGNTRSVKQCDGQYAGSNGQGVFILIGRDATQTGS